MSTRRNDARGSSKKVDVKGVIGDGAYGSRRNFDLLDGHRTDDKGGTPSRG